ncbi:hydroxypyruvate isomerase family protein [Pseudoroseicyclus sp. CXY001]|uniref:hydroxypyruvate isomerase family protein n=1 Tax=Pseudoroseicyclus sp. CXY001 TaxID=3242492 RepID=UPI0035709769
MPRFAADLAALWPGLSLPEAALRAADAGFTAVDIPDPYGAAVPELAEALRLLGLTVATISCPPPNYTGGQRGFAAVPGLETRFRGDLRRSLRYARALGAEQLVLMTGAVAEGADRDAARRCLLENLAEAAEAAEAAEGIGLLLRPVSPKVHPGAYLGDPLLAAEIVEAAGLPSLGLAFDAWHMHEMTGDVPGLWDRLAPQVRHVQVAGAPGRGEPAGGEIDYPAFFAALDAAGYAGWVSANYRPRGAVEAGLGWRG